MRILETCLICLLMTGCRIGRNPQGTLDRQPYMAVYCDLIQESLRGKNAGTDPRTAMQNAERVLANHGTTRAEFDSTTRWYNADVTRWKLFFDDAAKELESRELAKPLAPR
jgi:hypothetical protein